jgi:hypothetical protein
MKSSVLSANQTSLLLSRFPKFELSYETISHKKVSPEYNVCLAIPQSKKFYAYFSFQLDQDVCYIMELTREKKIGNITIAQTLFHPSLSLGTLLYGSLIETGPSKHHFLVEDMFFYKGISLRNTTFGHKLGFIYEFMQKSIVQRFDEDAGDSIYNIVFSLPHMWGIDPTIEDKQVLQHIDYPIHHLQYRSLNTICPFLNVFTNKLDIPSIIDSTKYTSSTNEPVDNNGLVNNNGLVKSTIIDQTLEYMVDTTKTYIPDFLKPQYSQNTVFSVCADLQNDIYHLYAYGKNCVPVYYDYAYIPNCFVSIFMNELFRNIKENANLDCIEESDDDDDFQDGRCDKYVDLTKKLFIECAFNKKFKRWIPLREVDAHDAKVVHITKLGGNQLRGTKVPPDAPSFYK